MRFEYRYWGESQVLNGPRSTAIQFAPDTLRKPVHFIADISRHLPFREAISALHDVVVSDLRIKRDLTTYKAWLAQNEEQLLADYLARQGKLKQEADRIQQELSKLRKQKSVLLAPYQQAQRAYFNHIYQHQREWWYVLDPVITVHPDCVFFECFSQDESTYANFKCSHNMFQHHGDWACGTTNIDYSAALYGEFQKIRQYKTTRLSIAAEGFAVKTANDENFVEQKIDLPDSWVRGFLQVSTAMALPARQLQLHPMDLHNFCMILRRHQERASPRSLRFELVPHQPVKVVFEPWGIEVVCHRSSHDATSPESIRIWGRRRLLTLERLIPVAERVQVKLLGTGLPSFWQVSGAEWQYTLGLSGWTANDWARSSQFDLWVKRSPVDSYTQQQVFAVLSQSWKASVAEIAQQTALSTTQITSSLLAYTQAGRVVYDLNDHCYRLRELTQEPLSVEALRFNNEREAQAATLVQTKRVNHLQQKQLANGREIKALVLDDAHYSVELRLDLDERLVHGRCQCSFFKQNKLYQGPCVHLLAARMAVDLLRH